MSYPEPYCTLECLVCFLPSLLFYSVHQSHKHYHLLLPKCAIYSLAFVSSFTKAHTLNLAAHLHRFICLSYPRGHDPRQETGAERFQILVWQQNESSNMDNNRFFAAFRWEDVDGLTADLANNFV